MRPYRKCSKGRCEGQQPGRPVSLLLRRIENRRLDPLWGTDDPAAGAWFTQQALQLAQLASPALSRA
jgi:endoglucanase